MNSNKEILKKANEAIIGSDNESFLSFCTDNIVWIFIGNKTLNGKDAIRQYMAAAYQEPPKFMVEDLIAEGEFVTAIGKISMKDENGKMIDYSYCDIWRFYDGKMSELRAFVIKT